MVRILLAGCLLVVLGSGCALVENKKGGIQYTHSTEAIEIQSPCQDFLLDVGFRKNGVNQLMAIDRIKLSGPKGMTETQACTDWVGPYHVKDTTVKQAKEPKAQFTGGWHGSNGNQTGEPTAKTVRYTLTADDKVVEEKSKGCADKIVLSVTNQITSYNTHEPVLEENIVYTLIGNKIDVHARITALKNAAITCYYGLQTQNNSWNDKIKYLYEKGEPVILPIKGNNACAPCKERSDLIGFELSATNHPYILHAWMNHDNPLTRFEYVYKTKPCAFTMDYGKSYFNLVNSKVLPLKKGQTIEWSGGYVFTSR